jgi:DNA mismatch endonuclease (patch repair protein)
VKEKKRTVAIGGGLRADYPKPSSANASAAMRGNRKNETKPEVAIRRLVHAIGFRYRIGAQIALGDLRIRPDIVLRRARLAVFVDGCFWHGCPTHGTKPRSNSDYWAKKIGRNRDRDRRNDRALRAAEWTVVRIWEHDDPSDAIARIVTALTTPRARKQTRTFKRRQ